MFKKIREYLSDHIAEIALAMSSVTGSPIDLQMYEYLRNR